MFSRLKVIKQMAKEKTEVNQYRFGLELQCLNKGRSYLEGHIHENRESYGTEFTTGFHLLCSYAWAGVCQNYTKIFAETAGKMMIEAMGRMGREIGLLMEAGELRNVLIEAGKPFFQKWWVDINPSEEIVLAVAGMKIEAEFLQWLERIREK